MATKMSLLAKKPEEDDNPKKKKRKDNTALSNQYSLYSGIVTEKGAKDNPSETEAIKNMANYMKNNLPPQADNPSNVYRPKFSHIGLVYDRNKKQSNS